MAKVTIVVEDNTDGTTSVGMEFDPPAKPNDQITSAMHLAFLMMGAAKAASSTPEELYDED